MPERISFVTVARDDSPEMLEATLSGVLETSAGHAVEIIVVDDGSREPVSLERPGVRVVRNAEPIGSARAWGLGVSTTGGGVLVSMDAHMRFAPNPSRSRHFHTVEQLNPPRRRFPHLVR